MLEPIESINENGVGDLNEEYIAKLKKLNLEMEELIASRSNKKFEPINVSSFYCFFYCFVIWRIKFC